MSRWGQAVRAISKEKEISFEECLERNGVSKEQWGEFCTVMERSKDLDKISSDLEAKWKRELKALGVRWNKDFDEYLEYRGPVRVGGYNTSIFPTISGGAPFTVYVVEHALCEYLWTILSTRGGTEVGAPHRWEDYFRFEEDEHLDKPLFGEVDHHFFWDSIYHPKGTPSPPVAHYRLRELKRMLHAVGCQMEDAYLRHRESGNTQGADALLDHPVMGEPIEAAYVLKHLEQRPELHWKFFREYANNADEKDEVEEAISTLLKEFLG